MARTEIGTYHHIAGKYLDYYAAESAWREDMRRVPFDQQAAELLRLLLLPSRDRMFKGYWQTELDRMMAILNLDPVEEGAQFIRPNRFSQRQAA